MHFLLWGGLMTGLLMHLESDGSRVTVRLHGSFDGTCARELAKALRTLGPCEVELDFSGVRQFADLAAGILASALERSLALRLRLTGVPDHPARVMRYCGIRDSTSDEESAPEP